MRSEKQLVYTVSVGGVDPFVELKAGSCMVDRLPFAVLVTKFSYIFSVVFSYLVFLRRKKNAGYG